MPFPNYQSLYPYNNNHSFDHICIWYTAINFPLIPDYGKNQPEHTHYHKTLYVGIPLFQYIRYYHQDHIHTHTLPSLPSAYLHLCMPIKVHLYHQGQHLQWHTHSPSNIHIATTRFQPSRILSPPAMNHP